MEYWYSVRFLTKDKSQAIAGVSAMFSSGGYTVTRLKSLCEENHYNNAVSSEGGNKISYQELKGFDTYGYIGLTIPFVFREPSCTLSYSRDGYEPGEVIIEGRTSRSECVTEIVLTSTSEMAQPTGMRFLTGYDYHRGQYGYNQFRSKNYIEEHMLGKTVGPLGDYDNYDGEQLLPMRCIQPMENPNYYISIECKYKNFSHFVEESEEFGKAITIGFNGFPVSDAGGEIIEVYARGCGYLRVADFNEERWKRKDMSVEIDPYINYSRIVLLPKKIGTIAFNYDATDEQEYGFNIELYDEINNIIDACPVFIKRGKYQPVEEPIPIDMVEK